MLCNGQLCALGTEITRHLNKGCIDVWIGYAHGDATDLFILTLYACITYNATQHTPTAQYISTTQEQDISAFSEVWNHHFVLAKYCSSENNS